MILVYFLFFISRGTSRLNFMTTGVDGWDCSVFIGLSPMNLTFRLFFFSSCKLCGLNVGSILVSIRLSWSKSKRFGLFACSNDGFRMFLGVYSFCCILSREIAERRLSFNGGSDSVTFKAELEKSTFLFEFRCVSGWVRLESSFGLYNDFSPLCMIGSFWFHVGFAFVFSYYIASWLWARFCEVTLAANLAYKS